MFVNPVTSCESTFTVTDTKQGVTKPYINAPGPPAPAVTDTNALATCP